MTTETVFRFRKYDINGDDYVLSTRMATMLCIRQLGAEPVQGTSVLVDARLVDRNGWTAKDFVPIGARPLRWPAATPCPGRQDCLAPQDDKCHLLDSQLHRTV